MMNKLLPHRCLTLFFLFGMMTVGCSSDESWPLSQSSFETPANGSKPIARWWWPGGSVARDQMVSELSEFAEMGFGGVEIQPFTFGLNFTELEDDVAIHTVGTDAFFDDLAFAVEQGQALGLEMDVTLGSGWPGGAPAVGEDRAEELLLNWYDVEGGQDLSQEPPALGSREYVGQVQQIIDALDTGAEAPELFKLVAARIENGVLSAQPENVLDISSSMNGDRLEWSAPTVHGEFFPCHQ